jgi:hypothetical protein
VFAKQFCGARAAVPYCRERKSIQELPRSLPLLFFVEQGYGVRDARDEPTSRAPGIGRGISSSRIVSMPPNP